METCNDYLSSTCVRVVQKSYKHIALQDRTALSATSRDMQFGILNEQIVCAFRNKVCARNNRANFPLAPFSRNGMILLGITIWDNRAGRLTANKSTSKCFRYVTENTKHFKRERRRRCCILA